MSLLIVLEINYIEWPIYGSNNDHDFKARPNRLGFDDFALKRGHNRVQAEWVSEELMQSFDLNPEFDQRNCTWQSHAEPTHGNHLLLPFLERQFPY